MMNELEKKCPLKFLKKSTLMERFECKRDKCAWWCEWTKCCAIAVIPAGVNSRTHEMMED